MQIRTRLECLAARIAVGWDMIGLGLHTQPIVEGTASNRPEMVVDPGERDLRVDRTIVVHD
jgi:hypothetical protein